MKDYKTKSNESPVVKHLLSIHKFDISMNIFFLYIFILYGIFVWFTKKLAIYKFYKWKQFIFLTNKYFKH